jgi:hypothetical protein
MTPVGPPLTPIAPTILPLFRRPFESCSGTRLADCDISRGVNRAIHLFEVDQVAGRIDNSESVQIRGPLPFDQRCGVGIPMPIAARKFLGV